MKKLYISMYHYTRDLVHSRYPNIKGMDITAFRHQIEYMRNHFNIVSMEQVIDAINRGINLPDNALLLTFDDGYIDNYTYAFPILQENGVQGSFFVPGKIVKTHELLDVNKIHYILACADIKDLVEALLKKMNYYRGSEYVFPSNEELWQQYAVDYNYDHKETIFFKRMLQTVLPEKLRGIISSELFTEYLGIKEEQLAYELYLSSEQIRTMKRGGMYFGIHGYDHYWLGKLDAETMKRDIDLALDVMGEYVDTKQWVMNYPYGNYSEQVVEYVRLKGAMIGLTIEKGVADITRDNPLLLPRFDCNDFPPKSSEYMKY